MTHIKYIDAGNHRVYTLTLDEAEKLRAKKNNEWAILHQADYILGPREWETLARLKGEVNALREQIDNCQESTN